MANTYQARLAAKLQSLGIPDFEHVQRLDTAPNEVQLEVLKELAERAFACQNVGNITLGRQLLLELPSSWLYERLDALLNTHLESNDEWEFRRIAEFLCAFDSRALEAHLRRCENHADPEICSIAAELRDEETRKKWASMVRGKCS